MLMFTYRRARAFIALMGVAVVCTLGGRSEPVLAQQPVRPDDELETIQIRPNVYMVAGAGANIAVQVGPIGLVVVDTGSVQAADEVLAAIKKVSELPIRYIFNTSADLDHVGGNEKLSKAGITILGGGPRKPAVTPEGPRAVGMNYRRATGVARGGRRALTS